MMEQCRGCGEESRFTHVDRICTSCYAEGLFLCGYCGEVARGPERGTLWGAPPDPRPTCAGGHAHNWCEGCAEDWQGVCPESDEARLARAVMA